MSIIASTDKHPVYLDNNGNPLAGGKINYYAIGTSTPKTVYTDYALTVPAANPQICEASGRTPTQIFLGQGQYTCISRKFNGTDPNTAPDTDWDNVTSQWVEEGQPIPSVASLTDAVYVTTIANLRLIDPVALSKSNFSVMGYWAEGDMFPRGYFWNPSELGSDNSGTIIRNPSIATGAFVLDVGNTDVMDCRIFGIFHNRAASNNSAIASMVTTVQATAKLPQTIFFPRGIYEVVGGTQYFDTKVIFDKNCQFKNTTAGTPYVLGIRSTFSNLSETDIKSVSSTGKVLLNFSDVGDTTEVDVRWYGAKNDATTDDGPAFEDCLANVTKNYPIRITTGTMRIASLSTSIDIYNILRFYNSGKFNCDQNVYNINFTGSTGYLENYNVNTFGVYTQAIVDNNLDRYFFTDYTPIKASLIVSDMSRYIKGWNSQILSTTNEKKQEMILDVDTTFGETLSLAECSNWSFRWTNGVSTCTTANPVHLPSVEAPSNARIFRSVGFYVGGTSHADWFPNIRAAILSVCSVGGTLDLDGNTYSTSTAISVTESAEFVTIRNGKINITASITWLSLAGYIQKFTLDNMFIYGAAYAINGITTTNTIDEFYVNNCYINCTNTSSGVFIGRSSSGRYSLLTITNTRLTWYTTVFIDNAYGSVHCTNNILSGYTLLDTALCTLIGNTFSGGANIATVVESSTPAHITNNMFISNYLKCNPSSGIINHVITGNTFYGTDIQGSIIQLSTTTLNTLIKGLVIIGNNFIGTRTSYTRCIDLLLETGGSWASSTTLNIHSMQIAGNTGRTALRGVPQTECDVYISNGGIGSTTTGVYEIALSSNLADLLLIPDTKLQLGSADVTKSSTSYLLGAITSVDDTTTYGPWNPQVKWSSSNTSSSGGGGYGMWVRFKFYSRSDS